jgi:uncharacterized protein (TIGR02270 family)
MHRVDPGTIRERLMDLPDPAVRARMFRTTGEIGQLNSVSVLLDRTRNDPAENSRFWAAWSAVLLGARGVALDKLVEYGLGFGVYRDRAVTLALQTLDLASAHDFLRQVASLHQTRYVILGAGVSGSAEYVEWLFQHMADPRTTRLAAEAVTLITGVDIKRDHLEGKRPDDYQATPSDDADDEDVSMDSDEGLPWPDLQKLRNWWAANSNRFQRGTRYFLGAPITREHCIDVLKNGYQRQRILAAHYLCLLDPGTPLFNTSAPAWRQQRWLAKLT